MVRTPVSLLERLRQPGDEAAWGQFVDLYTPLLYHWARRAHLADQDAADLVQEVFIVLVRKLPEFTYDANKGFRFWLRKVTLNKWRELCRRQPIGVNNRLSGEENHLADQDPVEGFWEQEYRQFLVSRARELMKDQVEATTWSAFWQVVVEDQPAETVAITLGMTIPAVYAAKYRVLVKLRAGLQGLLE